MIEFDPSQLRYKQRQTTTPSGQASQIHEIWIKAQTLLSNSSLDQMLKACQGTRSQTETISVPAGIFAACKMTHSENGNTSTIWFGHAPFGIIKMDIQQQGIHTIKILKNYRFGTQ